MQLQIRLARFIINDAKQQSFFTLRHIHSINPSDDFHHAAVRQLKGQRWQKTAGAKIDLQAYRLEASPP
ncbi:hypothetical protein D3C73_1283220 [compost metagenome]